MLYSPTDITNIIALANTTLYKLAQKSEKMRWIDGEDIYENELGAIYDLKLTVEYGKTIWYSDEAFHGVCAYLKYKCNAFGFGTINPYYSTVTSTPPVSGTGSSTSGWLLYKQYVIGVTAGGPTPGTNTFTNSGLINRNVFIVLDALPLAVGLTDRQSYVFDSPAGAMEFVNNLEQNQVLQIYTYATGSGSWPLLDEFTVGDPGKPANGATTYTNAALIGKRIIVEIDGAILPTGLPTVFSFTFNALTGQITWSSGLSTSQHTKIYEY